MPTPVAFARDRFASLLSGTAVSGAFSARRTARPDGLRLEVRGVGPIAMPVPIRQAKELCLIGRPARFGKGEQTLLDAAVRDTWEVPKSRIAIDKRHWNATLRPVLDRLRTDLGLPAGCELVADLHSMLVYAPGQFFAPHQDSEKADGMIGTLVVTLPSASTGGELTVEHAGRTATYRSSKEVLSLVAFYADCRHHVSPVTSGYRVVLTYNLLLKGDTAAAAASQADPAVVAELSRCLNEHFGDREEPARLIYLLDHEYTERALGWARLKGTDASRAAAVRAAADAAGCEATLALAEVHEMWSAYEAERSWSRGRGRYWDVDEEDGDREDPAGELDLQELMEASTTLDCWLDESGVAAPTSLFVDDDEVCATTPTETLSPHRSAYEGYMGNYGNTLDRWYRRAVVVLWPRRWAFAIRAEASPAWALARLADLVRAGDLTAAREGAATLASSWGVEAGNGPLLGSALAVARDLDEPGTAAMLLAPFQIEMVTPAHAQPLAELAGHYGESWIQDVVDGWNRRVHSAWHPDRAGWLGSLPALCEALCAAGPAGVLAARRLAAGAWARLRESADMAYRYDKPSERRQALGQLGPSFAALLSSTAPAGAADLRDEVVAVLRRDDDDMTACALSTLREAGWAPGHGSALDVVATHCARRLEARLAAPVRAGDDWSVGLPKGCDCDLCTTLRAFLADPVRRRFEWPLAEQRRRHVHRRIDDAELPVDHHTRRSGRPYTLVLIKTDDLFGREREARQRDLADLAWLSPPARVANAGGRNSR